MAIAELTDALQNQSGLIVRPEEPLASHTPLRVGGPVELWVEAHDESGLIEFTRQTREHGGKWRIHWPFADWLVRDGGLRGTVLRLGAQFERITVSDEHVTMGSASLWSALPADLEGGLWDAVRSWPGSVGGLFESGQADELSKIAAGIKVMRGGKVVEISWPSDGAPRLGDATVLLSITLRRVSAARSWLAGPDRSGTLFGAVADTTVARELEKAGVLGTRLRRWRLSVTQPGAVVHLGGGTFSDLQMLVKGIKMRVEKTRGITLETRIPVLGNEPGRRNR
jgi:UDP-N-acetylmuramate dehydrogenase